MKHPSPTSLREMAAAIRGTDIAARQWLDEGFSPGDAQAYVAAGCFDVPRTAELRQLGIGPLEVARSGVGWDYCSGNVTLAEVRSMLGHTPKSIDRTARLLC